ncbi:MAG: NAD(P)(+) transhydrogenase (Re/Si-specific) subunit beta [Saprospiraceae bacterium]|nr:NAD(P)(+) transhydrogenase (Re/Si-specific) subunit beta [Saprospiraceae bacterium]
MTTTFIVNLFYLLAAVGFVWGLRLMGHPETARKGNFIAGSGMILAILAALMEPIPGAFNNNVWIFAALVAGAVGGYYMISKPPAAATMLQAMPIFNGLGGASAMVLGLAEILLVYNGESAASNGLLVILLLSILIGGGVFTGSFLVFVKINGLLKDGAVTLNRHSLINILLVTITVFCGIFVYLQGDKGSPVWAILFTLIALISGLSLVAPIHVSEMKWLASLLNACSGVSVAAVGLVYGSHFLLVGGMLVAAAGLTLMFRIRLLASSSPVEPPSADPIQDDGRIVVEADHAALPPILKEDFYGGENENTAATVSFEDTLPVEEPEAANTGGEIRMETPGVEPIQKEDDLVEENADETHTGLSSLNQGTTADDDDAREDGEADPKEAFPGSD